MASPVDVGAYRLFDVTANGPEALGEFGCCDAIAGQALVINPLELLQLTGLESLQIAVNGVDMRSPPTGELTNFNSYPYSRVGIFDSTRRSENLLQNVT